MPIRMALSDDLDKIMKLIASCIKDLEAQGIFQWDDNYPTAEFFAEDIANNGLFIYENKGDCMGVVSINEDQSPEYDKLVWADCGGKVLVVHRLAVEPKWHRQGIGRQIMNFVEEFATANGYTSIRLDAYSGNSGALNLYDCRGYQRVGQLFFPRRELPFYCFEKIITNASPVKLPR